VQGICAYAMRHKILSVNPAASIGRLVRGDDQEEIRALTLAERKDLITKLRAHGWAKQKDKLGRPLGGGRGRVWLDMPDLVRAMLATGVRLGELLALNDTSFARDEEGRPVIHVTAHIVRENGEVIRKPYRKRSKKYLVLQVPEWSVSMWQRRQMTATTGEGPMFPSGRGSWMHPDVAGHRIREAFDACGYKWLKSHGFRKTVATVLAEAGLPSREIADQLGHADETTARKFYVAKVSNAAGAAALQSINPEE
jgi:integrase